jgi:hypothetical protein
MIRKFAFAKYIGLITMNFADLCMCPTSIGDLATWPPVEKRTYISHPECVDSKDALIIPTHATSLKLGDLIRWVAGLKIPPSPFRRSPIPWWYVHLNTPKVQLPRPKLWSAMDKPLSGLDGDLISELLLQMRKVHSASRELWSAWIDVNVEAVRA